MCWLSWPMELLAVHRYWPAYVNWMFFKVREETRAWVRTTMFRSRLYKKRRRKHIILIVKPHAVRKKTAVITACLGEFLFVKELKASTKHKRPKERRWRAYVYSRFAIKNERMEDEPGSELSNFTSFKKNN